MLGIVRFIDLYKPLGRLALLALALETERLALALCQLSKVSERCWSSLNHSKRKLAKEKYRMRFERNPELEDDTTPQRPKTPADAMDLFIARGRKYRLLADLIGMTNLDDKFNMIASCKKLIPPSELLKIKRHFHTLKKARDLCAHPSEEVELVKALPRELLLDFVVYGRQVHASLKKAWLDVLEGRWKLEET